MTDWLLRLVRWIAGPDRAEWADAMAAETGAAGLRSTSWALGCVGAVVIDRIRRSAKTVLSILLLPFGAFLLQFVLFFPTAWVFQAYDLPRWTILSFAIFEPLPVAILLGWLTARRGALYPAIGAFFVYYALAILHWWYFFGEGPSVFFNGKMEIHHLHAQLGMAVDLGIWLLGALIGSRWYRLRHA